MRETQSIVKETQRILREETFNPEEIQTLLVRMALQLDRLDREVRVLSSSVGELDERTFGSVVFR